MPFDGAGFAASDNRLSKIEDVIDLLATPDQWCQGTPRTPDGRFCILGALIAVNANSLRPVVLRAIHEVTGKDYRRIEAFNDHPDTNHRLVLRVLARARDNIVGEEVEVLSLPTLPTWRVRLQEWVQSFAAKKPA